MTMRKNRSVRPLYTKGTPEAGYTLIQVAIALVVIGVLSTPLIASYNLYTREQQTVKSVERIQGAVATIQNFRDMYGYYPCPAPMKTPRGVVGYGAATNCRTNAAITALAPGQCDVALGICVEQSIRATLTNRRVLVGTIPFRTLQMDEEEAFDSYGARLLYAVTESMTDDQSVDDTIGGIAVRKASGTPLLIPDGSAAFFIASPGPTLMGGYGVNGTLMTPCTTVTADQENCTVGFETGTMASPNSIYVSDVATHRPGTGFFDDQVSFFANTLNALWRRLPGDPEAVEDLSPKDVGMGRNLNPSVRLDIAPVGSETDTLRARPVTNALGVLVDSGLHVGQVCDENGANCFDPKVLGGDPGVATDPLDGTGGMECSTPGQYIIGIANGAALCGAIAARCPPATPVLRRVTGSGNLVCTGTPQPSCPAATFTACNPNDVVLPATAHGSSVTRSGLSYPAAGGCRRVTYKCMSGTWSKTSDTGVAKCSFTAPPPVRGADQSCDPGTGPGPWWTMTTTTCTGATVTTNNESTQCLCQSTTAPETSNCQAEKGPNYDPDQILTRIRTYNADCTSSAPPYDTSGCTCVVPNPSTRVVSSGSCPDGFTGSVSDQTQTFNPSTCDWEDDGPPVNSCICDLTPRLSYTDPTCSDPVCEHIASQNVFSEAKDPSTCDYLAPVQTQTGSCALNAFSWQYADSSTGSATSHDVLLGDPCTCDQRKSGTRKICRQSNGALARCVCN
ncbi:MAG TPA: hypothetical protein PKX87_00340 [Alphaproteobacteria bacterium]|nr:hypothetical protein [Alphaproteobacteria bacterium]